MVVFPEFFNPIIRIRLGVLLSEVNLDFNLPIWEPIFVFKLTINFSLIKTLINPKKTTGDYGYMLTNLELAEQYIPSITHESVKLTIEEFDRYLDGNFEKQEDNAK